MTFAIVVLLAALFVAWRENKRQERAYRATLFPVFVRGYGGKTTAEAMLKERRAVLQGMYKGFAPLAIRKRKEVKN